jgi:hypothetical protein
MAGQRAVDKEELLKDFLARVFIDLQCKNYMVLLQIVRYGNWQHSAVSIGK